MNIATARNTPYGIAAALLLALSLSCSDYLLQVNPAPPPAAPAIALNLVDTAILAFDTLHVEAASDSASSYVWTLSTGDDSVYRTDTTANAAWAHVWTIVDTGLHHLEVRALRDTLISAPVRAMIAVRSLHLLLKLPDDTAMTLGDTARIAARLTGADSHAVSIVWRADDTSPDTSDALVRTIQSADSAGEMLVVAQAFTSSGFHSNRDTCLITFVQPAISVSGDSAGRVGDTIHFSASIDSGGLQRWEYIWEIDSTRFFSADSLYARAWGRADTGRHVIVVMALSNEGRKTDIDTLVVHIRGQAPKVRLPADMMRSSLDSVRLTATVSDSDGVVDSYRWRIHDRVFAEGGNQITLRYNGADSVIVTVEVVDDDGYVDWDTCVVRFNTPPTTPALRSPVDDTMRVHLFDSSLFNHVVSFAWSADDADGPNDTLQYAAFLHVGADSVLSLYEGADTAASISGLDTGSYRWSVEVRDRFGHVRSDTAAFSVVLEKRICFIGHSIAVGVGGDSATGGFRAAVLHMLRSELNEHESLIPVGPVATGYLEPVRDDACAAIVGEVAPHIWQLLEYARPEINADMWVVYLGVNGSYNGTERDYIYKIINTIYGRNAAAQAVLIGGFPYHYYPVVSFNGWLYYTAEYMREDGRRIRYVDVDDPFTRSGYVNLSLVPDGIHPNQQGYDILSRMIADTLTMMQP